MKVGFTYSEKYSKYKMLIEKVINEISRSLVNNQIIVESSIVKSSRKKYDLYIICCDSKEDFDINFSKSKARSILITENLEEEYIAYVVNYVTDVIYAKNNIETIVRRIIDNIMRYK